MASAISQAPSIDVIPENLESQLSTVQLVPPEQIREFELFASNGTSFDTFIEQYKPSDNRYLNNLIVIGDHLSPILGLCNTPGVSSTSLTLCDSIASLAYELCQGTQYEVFLCISPDVPNYIKSRDLSEEQTSTLAYSLVLDLSD